MPTVDSHEGVSLLGEEGVVPFLAEGKAKATVLGADRVLMAKQRRPLQILPSFRGVLGPWGYRWVHTAGLVGFGR